jgi:Flp pilus assembly protein TadG
MPMIRLRVRSVSRTRLVRFARARRAGVAPIVALAAPGSPAVRRSLLWGSRRGVAAVEFGLVAPVLLMVFGGAADLGLGVWARSTLTEAVSQGAYYAFLTGSHVQPSAVQSMVQSATGVSGITASVSTPATYCASGNPMTLTATASTATCADGTTPGTYITISATYTMTSILPAFTGLGNSQLQESATVRLQ